MVRTNRPIPRRDCRARVPEGFAAIAIVIGLVSSCSDAAEDFEPPVTASLSSVSASTPGAATVYSTPSLDMDDVVVATIRTMDGADPCALLPGEKVREIVGEDASPVVRIEKTCEYHGRNGSIFVNLGMKLAFLGLVGQYPAGKSLTVAGNSSWQVGPSDHCSVFVAISPDPTALVFNVDVGELRPGGGMDTCGMAFELAELIVPVLPQV